MERVQGSQSLPILEVPYGKGTSLETKFTKKKLGFLGGTEWFRNPVVAYSPSEGHDRAGLPEGWGLSVSQLLTFSSMSEKDATATQTG